MIVKAYMEYVCKQCKQAVKSRDMAIFYVRLHLSTIELYKKAYEQVEAEAQKKGRDHVSYEIAWWLFYQLVERWNAFPLLSSDARGLIASRQTDRVNALLERAYREGMVER